MSTGRLGAGDTAIQPTILDAKGDLIVATAADTPARLAVGSANQVLTVDSSTATGLKWATPATDTNGFVRLTTASFSAVSDTGTTFDNLFTSSYDNYMIVFSQIIGSSGTADFHMQLRYAGPTTQAAGYNYVISTNYITGGNPANALTGAASQAQILLCNDLDVSGYGLGGVLNLTNVLSTGSRPNANWSSGNAYDDYVFGGMFAYTSRTYTGFLLKPSTGTISGTVSVYGLAKS